MNSRHPQSRDSFSSGLRLTDPTRVTAADIERLDIIHALLSELNDPRASAVTIAPFIAAFPPLKARVELAFKTRRPNANAKNLAAQLVLLGNREVEAVLLELLEDLDDAARPIFWTIPMIDSMSSARVLLRFC